MCRCFFVSAAILLLSSGFGRAADEPAWPVLVSAKDVKPLANTEVLDWEGDLASRMVEGIDRFLLKEIEKARVERGKHWQRNFYSPLSYEKSVEPNRRRLARLLGVDKTERPERGRFEYTDWSLKPRAEAEGYEARQVRWRAFGDVHGVGLLLEPKGEVVANVIAIPDADQSPEDIAGITLRGTWKNAFASELAKLGCRVLVPTLISRQDHSNWKMPNREWLHRPSYMLGRTLAGDETQKILAAVDCFSAGDGTEKVLVVGWGEGGRLALYAAALDTRIDGACVSGYFAPRERVWDEPAARTVFRLLKEFGDAEIASLVAPRPLVIEHSSYPKFVYRPDANGEPEVLEKYSADRGKPGKLIVPTGDEVRSEFARLEEQVLGLKQSQVKLVKADLAMAASTLIELLKLCDIDVEGDDATDKVSFVGVRDDRPEQEADLAERRAEQIAEIERHNQAAITESLQIRAEKFAGLKTDSLEEYEKSIEPFRTEFREEVIGRFDQPLLPANARSRPYQEGPKTVSYEVVLDVMPDVFAYGILTVPKDLDLAGGDRRPVVVCQHGLEGRPQDVISEESYRYYKAFATRLAERGFVTFAPQNIYLFYDRFRTLQFKANAVGCTLYSVMVPQHEQITRWLGEQPFVDKERIAFYGLSYGGKSAMRIPALVENYCLSICSGDFDEWVWKNAATDKKSLRYSYANKGEYEMYEFNLGSTFNYAEMAGLICPRPFMVERGHFDGVAPDEAVGYEYAKVRHLYQAKLGIGDRTEIEWFVGPHAIHGEGTFDFLHEHLDWPKVD